MPLNETQDAVMCEVKDHYLINVLAIHAIVPSYPEYRLHPDAPHHLTDPTRDDPNGSKIYLSSGAHIHIDGVLPHQIVEQVMTTLREAQAMILGRIEQSD